MRLCCMDRALMRKEEEPLTISKLDGSRVLLVLGNKEMDDFALDFAEMGMEDAHARKILLRLTRLACRKTGIETHGKRLNIEALSMEEGCYLLVTVGRSGAQRYRRRRTGGVCFWFEDCTAFLNAVEAAYRSRYYYRKTAAYAYQNGYALLFEYPAVSKALYRLMNEFAVRRGGALLSATVKEAGKPLCKRQAVAVIGQELVS